jgi:hypothetical protein
VTRAKGRFSLESQPGSGTRITGRDTRAPEELVKRARILLADDHSLILTGIRTLLSDHFDLVAFAWGCSAVTSLTWPSSLRRRQGVLAT